MITHIFIIIIIVIMIIITIIIIIILKNNFTFLNQTYFQERKNKK